MTQHRIILFRGMNTGGVRAPVAEQRDMAEAMGLKNPRTLQASGNLVVESGKATATLEAEIEAAMDKTFGLKVAAMVRTPEQWAKLIAGKSAIFKKATPRLLGMGTGRNWNTVLKLGEMVRVTPD